MRIPVLKHTAAPAPGPTEAEGEVQVWREQGRVCAYGYAAAGVRWIHLPNVGTFRLGTDVVVSPAPEASAERISDAFERSVLPMALHVLGGEALHASGVLGPAGVVAFCGDTGAGKSTLARALGDRGYTPWADDAVAFEISDAGVMAVPLPFRINLRPESAAALGNSGGVESSTQGAAAPLAAAVILRREDVDGTSLRRLSGAEGLRATLEQGYCYDPSDADRARAMVAAYLELVSRVPVIDACFQPGWEQFGALVDDIAAIVSGA